MMVGCAREVAGGTVVGGLAGGTEGRDDFPRWRRDDDGATTTECDLEAGRAGGTMAEGGAERGGRGGGSSGTDKVIEGCTAMSTMHPVPPAVPPLLARRGRKPLPSHQLQS